MTMRTRLAALLFLTCVLLPSLAFGVQYVDSPPLSDVIRTSVGDVAETAPLPVPLITWGGDVATIHGNGDADTTAQGSVFASQGLNLKLVRKDDFKGQVEDYLAGRTPYLRGTMGMLNMAAGVLDQDPRTKPVIIYQMTWSAGGDCLVVKEGINTAKDLKGKTIALQAYGPHVDYLAKILKDAGLSVNDVTIKWTADLTGTSNSPAAALQEDTSIDAAFVIIPDGLMLTSNGAVGTGSEGSVRGARILLSTKTANRIIADVYAVRSDYFQAHRAEVQSFVHGLLQAEEALRGIMKQRESRKDEYRTMVTAAATILLDSPQAIADTEGLLADCEFVGFQGNTRFFGDANWPRNFSSLTSEIQTSFVSLGLLSGSVALAQAEWDYNQMRAGLTGVDAVEAPRFRKEAVTKAVAKKQALGTLGEGELFSFEIYFQPNQNTFPAEQYTDAFNRVVELAATYGGAVITVEGHSDPLGYLRNKKEGAAQVLLKQQKQAAKNLSMTRALSVRDAVVGFARGRNVALDDSQFTTLGHGIMQPKAGMCGQDPCAPQTKEEWLANMRVVFRVIQMEAEADVFQPLN